ncbi:hypothetical protein C6A36_00405 [Desulfobacteraceae bacterium SEEP-SAG10]|nr:hypothetical protein C6A36_00405 [Desulfobacteraceae bacterium SEEP-SAG10]
MVEQISSLKTGVKYKDTPIGKVPVDWEVVRLENISLKFYNGGTPDTTNKDYWNGKIPWVTGADFENQKVNRIRRYISDEGVKNSATNIVQKGNILVVTRTGVGKLAIAPVDIAISQDITGIVLYQEKALSTYIYWYLNHNENRLKAIVQGTSINGLLRDDLESFAVSLPPVQEQKKIAQIISTLDDAIEKTIQVIEKAKELKKGLMQTLFTSGIGHKKFKKTILGKIPVEWEVKKLGQVSELKNGINFRKEQKGQQGILTIDVLNMYSSSIFIEPNSLYRVNLNLINKKDYILKEGDILFVRSSVKKEGVGWACLFKPFDEQATFCGFLIRARLLKTNISPEFLAYFLRSDRVRGRLISGAGHAAITNISQNTLQDLDIVIPSFGEQKEIVKALSLIVDQIEKESNHLEQLKLLKKGLMQVLLTGKLRVTV